MSKLKLKFQKVVKVNRKLRQNRDYSMEKNIKYNK